MHPYAYAYADPVGKTDPTGMQTDDSADELACWLRGGTWDDAQNRCRERVPLPPPHNPASVDAPYRSPRSAVMPGVNLPGVGMEANPNTGTLGLPPAGTVNPPRVRGGTGVSKLIGVIGLLCLATAANTLSKTENPPTPTCDQYTIPAACASDFTKYPDTSFQCYKCATNAARKIQAANPVSIVLIVELQNSVGRPFLQNRDGEPVSKTGYHEVVAIDNKCYIDALVYKLTFRQC